MKSYNLEGKIVEDKGQIILTYKGGIFDDKGVQLGDYIKSISATKLILEEVVKMQRRKEGEIDMKYDVYVKVEDGSVTQVLNIIGIGLYIMPHLINFFSNNISYFLGEDEEPVDSEMVAEIKNNPKIRSAFSDIVNPVVDDEGTVILHMGSGDINYTREVSKDERDKIVAGIKKEDEEEDEEGYMKEEILIGTISVSKYYEPNPFSFRISHTDKDVPLVFSDLEFDSNKRKDLLGKRLQIEAVVTYKKEKVSLIEVVSFKEVGLFSEEGGESGTSKQKL